MGLEGINRGRKTHSGLWSSDGPAVDAFGFLEVASVRSIADMAKPV